MSISLNAGFGLVEVLFSWLIILFISLGMLIMQVEVLQIEKHTYYATIANIQIENLIERFRANASAVFREKEFHIWNAKNMNLLPKAHGEYDCAQGVCKISLFWSERKEQKMTLETVV